MLQGVWMSQLALKLLKGRENSDVLKHCVKSICLEQHLQSKLQK